MTTNASSLEILFDCREHFDADLVMRIAKEEYKLNTSFEVKNTDPAEKDVELLDTESAEDHQRKMLKISDIAFRKKDTTEVFALVEHKQVDDYLKSLKPGHLQPKRLMNQLRAMKKSNVPHLILLLSGDFSKLSDSDHKGLKQ